MQSNLFLPPPSSPSGLHQSTQSSHCNSPDIPQLLPRRRPSRLGLLTNCEVERDRGPAGHPIAGLLELDTAM